MTASTPPPLPTYFISHGGGPWPWMKDQMPFDVSVLEASLQAIPHEIGVTPKAVLVVSGHWEEPEFTVQTSPHPPMLYDYGVFAPLYAVYPDADVPILQLSLRQGYSPEHHLAAGRALAPLRHEGVLIVRSGLSYHNLRLMGAAGAVPSQQFDRWLTHALVESSPEQRVQLLTNWELAPSARIAHPSEDHLIPLMVAVGAAEDEVGVRGYHEETVFGSITASSFRFGTADQVPGR